MHPFHGYHKCNRFRCWIYAFWQGRPNAYSSKGTLGVAVRCWQGRPNAYSSKGTLGVAVRCNASERLSRGDGKGGVLLYRVVQRVREQQILVAFLRALLKPGLLALQFTNKKWQVC